jgi:hypothetical protein
LDCQTVTFEPPAQKYKAQTDLRISTNADLDQPFKLAHSGRDGTGLRAHYGGDLFGCFA